MITRLNSRYLYRSVVMLSIVAGSFFGASRSPSAALMTRDDFVPIALDGLGDRQNSFTWSMKLWNDKLYVGTSRSNYCVQQATLVRWFPYLSFLYPPLSESGFECTDSPQDLLLEAEIWCYTPDSGEWDLLFKSPRDVPIPGHPGKFVARDTGFRTMALFTEADGAEALYVGGICSESINPGVPPPRLLRCIDGRTFVPVPQDPGTFLGSLTLNGFPFNGFRSLQVYKDRMFAVASEGFNGNGALIEASHPEAGNDAFRFAAPEDEVFYQLATYNGFLYAGKATLDGFSVVKTDATGTPPFDFVTVIPLGGFLRPTPSLAVVSMYVYEDRLYIGTDRPAELYRINPDDSWELIVGQPRITSDDVMYPLSGLGPGFDNPSNIHMWRMQDAYGALYTGTMDQSTKWSGIWPAGPIYEPHAGFDLFATVNGYYYTMVTRNGLIDKFDEGLRQFAYSPDHGLFLGSSNIRFGCDVWQAMPDPTRLLAPQRLEAEEVVGGVTLIVWEVVPGAARYHVYRSNFDAMDRSFKLVGQTSERYFVDTVSANFLNPAHYYVVAEDQSGLLSGPSNMTRMPVLGEVATFLNVRRRLLNWGLSREAVEHIDLGMAAIFWGRDYRSAASALVTLRDKIVDNPNMIDKTYRTEEAVILLDKLLRRILYVQAGVVEWWRLIFQPRAGRLSTNSGTGGEAPSG